MIAEKVKKVKRHIFRLDIVLSCLLAATLVIGFKELELFAGNYEENLSYKKSSNQLFGYDLDYHDIREYRIKKEDKISDILIDQGISHDQILEIEKKAKDVFSLRKIRYGKDFHFVRNHACGPVKAVVYQPGPLHYVVYNLEGDKQVELVERPYTTCTEIATGKIRSSLWNALVEQSVNPSIIGLMEDALSSSVDFYHTQKDDEFKLVYEKKYVGDEEIGIGKLLGAYYKNSNGEHYAVHYENGKYKGYYDYEGRPSRKAFLKSPVKFTRISSGYSLSRLHPVRGVRIPHFGTDYAAPYGTPIRSVADGVVEEATYRGNNGKFVKIRHNKTYQTQYLHMQKFAAGIRPGVRVRQGQTIGYVGSTGLATGPHVCFRFWKNGKQVNHLKENFAPAEPMPASELPNFYITRDRVKDFLDGIPMVDSVRDYTGA